MSSTEQQQVLDWDVEESGDNDRQAQFVNRGGPGSSTKVMPMGAGTKDGSSPLTGFSTNGRRESIATYNDADMEIALQQRETEGFHYQRSKGMRNRPAGSRMVGGKKPHNMEAYNKFESTEYIIPDTAQQESVFMTDTKSKRKKRYYCLWVLYFLIGISVSLVIKGVLTICGYIEKSRVYATTDALKDGNVMEAWLIWTGTSVAMCVFAACLVLIEPAAASSGIPGLIAYLNGVKPSGGISHITGKETSFTSLSLMAAKFIGMIASIPSGMCIGPEGPIIHISALLAYWTAQLFQYCDDKLSGRSGTRHSVQANTQSQSEQRDFLATGAACGICTAFRAPLAGTLFVVEEAASFFTTRHLEFTFFACLAAYWCQWLLGFNISGEDATLSKFNQVTGFFCNLDTPIDMLLYFIIATIGGWMGALFNHIVEHVNHLRGHHINKRGWARVLEVFCIALLTGSAVVFLPMLSKCRLQDRSLMLRDSAGCLSEEDIFQISHGNVDLKYAEAMVANADSSNWLAGNLSSILYEEAKSASSHDGHIMLDNMNDAAFATSRRLTSTSARTLTAADASSSSSSSASGSSSGGLHGSKYIHLHYEHSYTCIGPHDYSDMAMLWLNGGVKGVKVLLQRGFPHMISPETLALFCVVYFFLAAITAGTSVPAGLVVPMLLIGGSMGRLMGLGALEFHKLMCTTYEPLDGSKMYDVYHWSTHFRWMIRDCRLPDPGTFAVIGMASFMGGSGRITVMLATVILELTADAGLIAPVGITCVIAMLVGNLFNHGLYHGLIPLMNLPFLNASPAPIMFVSRVRDIMGTVPIVWLPQHCHIGELVTLKKRYDKKAGETNRVSHNAFPVVVDPNNLLLQGMINRDAIDLAILDYANEKRRGIICTSNHEDGIKRIDLMHYCDRGPLTVHPHTTVARAYMVFRKLGLRHLPVVQRNGEIAGMVTRKSLMLYKLVECHEREMSLVKYLQESWRKKKSKTK